MAKSQNGQSDVGRSVQDVEVRFRRLTWLLIIPFFILFGRLWYLQIWQHDHYQELAFNNFIDRSGIPSERGLILDSEGRILAENVPSYNVVVTPAYIQPKGEEDLGLLEDRVERLRQQLMMTTEDAQKIVEKIHKTRGLWRFEPIVVMRSITRDQVAQIMTNRLDLPGVEVKAVSSRRYPYNDLGAHVVGYVNEINQRELDDRSPYGYKPGDMIGRTGVERAYESTLRGGTGVHADVVDSRGMPQTDTESLKLLGDWQDVPPIPGMNIVLTLDVEVNRIMKEAMQDYASGAAVALDPQTGRILGILSRPGFNPNAWSGRLSRDEHLESDTSPYKPMLDKSLLSYFPGSTYKIVTAMAALEADLVAPDHELHCPGYYEYGNKRKRRFRCWKRSGHDGVNLAESLQGSCDVFFYKVGESLGMDKLAEYARELGFGTRSGVGINTEASGVVPTKAWHRKHSPDGFRAGLTLSTAVGQGDTKVSPLQLALSYAALANGGTLYYPTLVDRIETADGHVVFEYPVRERHKLEIRPETLNEIVRGLDMVVNTEDGTAYAHRLDYVRVAGKTGTAQVVYTTSQQHEAADDFRKRDHAWFAAFAPVEDPEIVVIVFLEHGGSGGKDAAPVAMEIIDRFFLEVKGYDRLHFQPKEREPAFLKPRSGGGNRRLISEPGAAQPRWR